MALKEPSSTSSPLPLPDDWFSSTLSELEHSNGFTFALLLILHTCLFQEKCVLIGSSITGINDCFLSLHHSSFCFPIEKKKFVDGIKTLPQVHSSIDCGDHKNNDYYHLLNFNHQEGTLTKHVTDISHLILKAI